MLNKWESRRREMSHDWANPFRLFEAVAPLKATERKQIKGPKKRVVEN